jgi:hypothetical protein
VITFELDQPGDGEVSGSEHSHAGTGHVAIVSQPETRDKEACAS